MDIQVNIMAVVAAAVAYMAIGAFWYSPLGFGKMWAQMMGFSMDGPQTPEMKQKMIRGYAVNFVAALISSYVMAHFVSLLFLFTLQDALMFGFWVWLGFVATVMIGVVLWEGKPWKLYFLNAAYQLVAILTASAILTLWQ